MKIAFHYLGCRLNEAENEQIARVLIEAGHCMTTLEDAPDVILLNTCGVTSEAMRKSRNYARRMAANAPQLLVLMGCAIDLMAAGETPVSDEDLTHESETRVIRILRKDRPQAAQIILNAIDECSAHAQVTDAERMQAAASYKLRMRSFIKIQDGCNNQCTYCSVRLARGPERSESAEQIIAEIQKCLTLGEREIVLTGVQLGAWHENQNRLPWLISHILEKTDVQRLRLSSIEPWHVRPELWLLWQDKRLCPHFHIPVQSGSDAVLTAMKRRTPIEGYLQKLEAIRQNIPNVRISTDLIVGFPGETDEMWQETMQFIDEAQFDDVHLFRFSARPGTLAASLPNPVSPEVKRMRWNQAQERIQNIQKQRLMQTVGQHCEVLWENAEENLKGNTKLWSGYSQNYLQIFRAFETGANMRGQITHEVFTEADIKNQFSEHA